MGSCLAVGFQRIENSRVRQWKYRPDRKRVICMLPVLTAGVFLGYSYFLSWLLGYLVTKVGAGRAAGRKGRVRSIYIPLGNYTIHLHHWMIAVLMMPLAFTASIPFVPPVVICGFLSGIAFQGIYNYHDWYRIIKRRYQEAETDKAAESALPEVQL